MKKSVLLLCTFLTACGNGQSIPQVIGNLVTTGTTNGIKTPSPGQWVVYGGNVSVNSNGSFTFGNSGAAGQGIGYVYTGYSGNPNGKTLTFTYTVSGAGTVVPSQASGYGDAEVRPFMWRKNDDLSCSSTTEWYRLWSRSAGPLTAGTHTVSTTISTDQWTDCLHNNNSLQFNAAMADLLGIGFTFGAEFFGHGAYSTGQNGFSVDGFVVK